MLNMQNYLIKSLAVVGTISLIIMACSADEANNSNDTNSTANTNAIGKYQISGPSTNIFHVLNTETGVVKSYYNPAMTANPNSYSSNFVLYATTTANP
jgi:hypothetical protein